MSDGRTYLPPGTIVGLEYGNRYVITGAPIGCGGGSIIYPAERIRFDGESTVRDGIIYALKECYPVSSIHAFSRDESGGIRPSGEDDAGFQYLSRVREMQRGEMAVTQRIYRTASRMLPVLESADAAALTIDGKIFKVRNTYTVMESLAAKGRSLNACIEEYGFLQPVQAFHIVRQILFALREVHRAGFLHLDLQGGNIFVKGTLEDGSDLVTLIDFGSARELRGGKTDIIRDRVIFTTQGFSAPEILLRNDGTLQLGPEADIYSVGCILLFLLTGVRFDVRQLIRNTSGQYLTRFKLRKLNCPRHLTDRMQAVIARALAPEPEDRYHSAEEMLSDVSGFLKALTPREASLSGVHFDAFICYRHGEWDSAAALALRRDLEQFRAPRGIGTKRRPFQRVFLDEGELASCADFGAEIREALKNSGWLIVICSSSTPSSPWVNEEIEAFLATHDRSRILAVLTEGEPETSFPPLLLGGPRGQTEILAADARRDSLKTVLRKLNGDALLKLAAPMLGTTFDSLKQRDRIRKIRRLTAAVSSALLLTGLFSMYAVIQGQRIRTELQRTQTAQSRYLAKQSETLLKEGDRVKALQLSLAALPADPAVPERPVVPEAVRALKEASYAYRMPNPGRFLPSLTLEPEHPVSGKAPAVNASGTFCALIDVSGRLCIFDTESGLQKMAFRPADLDSTASGDQFLHAVFSGEDRLFAASADRLFCTDPSDGSLLWKMPFSRVTEPEQAGGSPEDRLDPYGASSLLLSADGSTAAAVTRLENGLGFYSFRAADGTPLRSAFWSREEMPVPAAAIFRSAVLSPDGISAAIGITRPENLLSRDTAENLLFLCPSRGTSLAVSAVLPDVSSLLFQEDGSLLVLSESASGYALELLDPEDSQILWTIQGTKDGPSSAPGQLYAVPSGEEYPEHCFAAALGNHLCLIDSLGTELRSFRFPGALLSAAPYGSGSWAVCLEDGSVYLAEKEDCVPAGNAPENTGVCRAAVFRGRPDQGSELLLLPEDGRRAFLLSTRTGDPDFTALDLPEPVSPDLSSAGFSAGFLPYEEKSLRYIRTARGLSVYEPLSTEPLFSVPVSTLEETPGIRSVSGEKLFFYVDCQTLIGADAVTGETRISCPLPGGETYDRWEFAGWLPDFCVFRNRDSADRDHAAFLLADLRDGSVSPLEAPATSDRIRCSVCGENFGIAAVCDPSDGTGPSLLFCDPCSGKDWYIPEAGKSLRFHLDDGISFRKDGQMQLSRDGSLLAVVSGGRIAVLEPGKDTVRLWLEAGCLEHCGMAFAGNDYLVVWDDAYRLSAWDLSSGACVSSPEEILSAGVRSAQEYLTVVPENYVIATYGSAGAGSETAVFTLDRDGLLTPYLHLCDADLDPYSGEVLNIFLFRGRLSGGFYRPQSLGELVGKGRALLRGRSLSPADAARYFLKP